LGLHSLRLRLFVSFALLVVLALVMAAGIFVALNRDASDRETLNQVEASAPAVSFEVRGLYDKNATAQEINSYLHQAARERDVRILLVDVRDGTIAADSADSLSGKRLDFPSLGQQAATPLSRFVSWHGATAETRGLTFFFSVYGPTAKPFTLGRSSADAGANLTTVVAVPREAVANAWLGLLPGLLWAGLAALALSAVMASILARSIARPISALTYASEAIAKGDFEQEVQLGGADEIGRLALAFNAMTREVGRSYLQTRSLIANISHDLKTPLTSILGFAQALHDGATSDPAEVKEMSGIILEEAARIFAAVEDLLYLSELEAGEVILRKVPVDLSEIAARCVRRLEPTVTELQLRLESSIEPGIWVLGDAGKIERILDNLLDNARKYTPKGGTITLAAEHDPSSGQQARIRTINSGSYIPPEELDRIFDRFYRRDRSRGSANGGTGLGLAIVKDLVQLHNGSIRAFSSPTEGTTFELHLPLDGAPAAPAAPALRTIPALVDGAGLVGSGRARPRPPASAA
jgi:signal transduction histidine kinase